MQPIIATCQDGVFAPEQPVELREGARVTPMKALSRDRDLSPEMLERNSAFGNRVETDRPVWGVNLGFFALAMMVVTTGLAPAHAALVITVEASPGGLGIFNGCQLRGEFSPPAVLTAGPDSRRRSTGARPTTAGA